MIVWPANLDGAKSRRAGRRIPVPRAVRQPTVKEIAQASTALGLSPEIVERASPPSSQWEKLGNVVVKKTGGRQSTMKLIASEILKSRQREANTREQRKEKR